jgi:hypothetical protein
MYLRKRFGRSRSAPGFQALAVIEASEETTQKMTQNSDASNDLTASGGFVRSGQASAFSSTTNVQTLKRVDKKSVTQNNIKIGTLVGQLHIGPSFTIAKR